MKFRLIYAAIGFTLIFAVAGCSHEKQAARKPSLTTTRPATTRSMASTRPVPLQRPVALQKPAAAPAPVITETAAQRDARMAWWRDARFGMFIHWGLYSIPAGEWHGQKTPHIGEWIMHDLKIPRDEYAQLESQFDPKDFNADRWAQMAKDAGMKYIVITTKHHDGFSLFDSQFTDYDVMHTPFHRDVMKELATATRARGLKIGWYYSILDWHDPNADSEATFPTYETRMRSQVRELLTNYGPIGLMWFDGDWIKEWNDQRGQRLYDLCRSLQPRVIVNNRVGHTRGGMNGFSKPGGFAGDYATPEQQIPKTAPAGADWETCMTINDTWGFKKDDRNWKSSRTLIRDLISTASKGGNFLLNVGPDANGDIPPACVQRLFEIGTWMKANGESIYGTQASPFADMPWGRVTMKGNTIYLHIFDWPADGKINLPLRNEPARAYLLADRKTKLDCQASDAGLVVTLPAQMPDANASVVALELAEPAIVIAPVR